MNIQEIKEKMKSRGITQIKLSELSGIPLQTLRKIFAGITPTPRIDTVEAIEKALTLDNKNKIILTKNEIELITKYRSLKPATQNNIKDLIMNL